ncbi:MAG: phenylalanine--tRNA ligase subunit beta, partial [Chitinophagaceae bacterium]
LKELIIGEILSIENIPNANKIRLTQVKINPHEVLQIVCGATNIVIGQKVVVALPNTILHPVKGESFTIKKSKIRGIESNGMICAEDEIGIGESHSGIMVLPDNTPIGKSLSELFDIYTDTIYEIGITPNRVDAMSHYGIARDICAYLSFHEQKVITPILPPILTEITPEKVSTPIKITIIAKEACKRYSSLQISNVKIENTPSLIKNRLQAIGQKSINNMVDLANYVLLELGQPLHTFDTNHITGNEIIIKNAIEKEKFLCLDDKKRMLQSTDLMICNTQEPMCIAGIFGGLKSGISINTTEVFIESAWFNPINIRRTSKYHNLRTEAAIHFEKYVDISQTIFALQRMAFLMKKYMNISFSSKIQDVYFQNEKKKLSFSMNYLHKIAGKQYEKSQVEKLLLSMQFEIISQTEDTFMLKIPLYKTDIHKPIDLVEEVIRIDGMDNITLPQEMTLTPSIEKKENKTIQDKIANYLCGFGFYEVINNSLTHSKQYDEEVLKTVVKLKNNLSVEHDIMRPSLLEGGLKNISYNIAHKQYNLKFFEFGNTYQKINTTYHETAYLGLWITGNYNSTSWQNRETTKTDFFRLKGICEQLFALFRIEKFVQSIKPIQHKDFSIAYDVEKENQPLLQLGEIALEKLQYFDIKQKVFFAKINLLAYYNLVQGKKIKYEQINKMPLVVRDLAFLINKKITYAEILKSLQKAKIPFLENIFLFDLFEDKKLGIDKKSMAFRFYLHHPKKTLTEKEIKKSIHQIIQLLEQQFQVQIRQES